MSIETLDASKIDAYEKRAKESWGSTKEWADYEKRSSVRTREEELKTGEQLMALFAPFAQMATKGADPASDEATSQASLIQDFISEHFYECSNEIFAQLGRAYGAGGELTHNINNAAGSGAAEYASKAVTAYCNRA